MHHLHYETTRRQTFNDWPIAYMNTDDLSKCGFYYLKDEDLCACIFCGGIVGKWKKGDIPQDEHKRLFANCPFVKGLPVGNIPTQQDLILSKLTIPAPPSNSTNINVCGSKDDMFMYSGPKMQDYDTYEKRLESYRNWPRQITQTPQQLAMAGFFHCGRPSFVLCYMLL